MVRRCSRAAAVLAGALVVGCANPRQTDANPGFSGSGRLEGVAFALREVAHDGTHPVPSTGETQEVDANARLVVSFSVATPEDLAAAGPEWATIQGWLNRIAELGAEARAVDELEVDETDLAAVEDAKATVQRYYRGYAGLFREFRDRMASERPDVNITELVGAPGAAFTENIARWLRQELDRLRIAARDRAMNRERVQVLVQAYLEPRFGDRSPLHVDNYDNLPVGDLRPIDRTGLKLSPQERARVQAEIAASAQAAAAIREIEANGKGFVRGIEQQIDKLRRAVRTLAGAIRSAPDWRTQLQAALTPMQNLANTSEDAEVKAAAAALATALPTLLAAIEKVGQQGNTRQWLEAIANGLRDGDPQSLLALTDTLTKAVETDLTEMLVTFDGEATKVRQAVRTLTDRMSPAQFDTLLPESARAALNALPQQLPATFAFVDYVKDLITSGKQRQTVAEVLAKARDVAIPRPLDDLPDATIDLTRAGVDLGDHVSVHVRFEEPGQDKADKQEPKVLQESSVDTQMVLTGLHRRIGGKLIFARADRGPGDAEQWKANVAAVASWHYRCRDAYESGWETFWNFLDPGFGVHLASLDQTPDNAEVGIGVNLSFFGGFITGGVGFNLAADNGHGEYYFVGIDLLDVLKETGSAVGVGR